MSDVKKLDFVIVGGQKCGTTSLAGQLASLASVCFCHEKEPQFFSKTQNIDDGLKHYLAMFESSAGQLLGEASTTYSFINEYPETPSKLFQHNPDLKVIFMLRDPVARIESHFNHRLRNGVIHNNPVESIGQHGCFIERSQYFKQLQAYLTYFPKAQIKVVFFEDYIKDSYDVLANTCEFLNIAVPAKDDVDVEAKNVSDAALKFDKQPLLVWVIKLIEKMPFAYKVSRWLPVKIRFSKSLKRLLWQALESDVLELERFLGISCQRWRDKYQFHAGDRIQ